MAGSALLRRREAGGEVTLPAIGLGLGVAKLGLSLLQRRLHARGGRRQASEKDRLRGVSARSKAVTKSHRGATVERSRTSNPSSSSPAPPAPLQQLSLLFPGLDRSVLGDMLAMNQGNLETTIDQLLSLNTDSFTPTPAIPMPGQSSERFEFPPSRQQSHPAPTLNSPLPPCPDCPVCLTPLTSKKIYQCANGHHVCQDCKRNPQLKVCPTCRQKLVGRATNMEQFLETIYGSN